VRLHSGQHEGVLFWLSRQVEFTLSPNSHLLWATDDMDGRILGAMGFGGRMGKAWGSISIALAEKQAGIPLIRAGAAWLFGMQEAKAGYVTISAKRKRWIESLVRTVGFVEVDRVKWGIGPHEDLVILKLTPETCRPWQTELKKLQRSHALQEAG
jgi:hypothetical protein